MTVTSCDICESDVSRLESHATLAVGGKTLDLCADCDQQIRRGLKDGDFIYSLRDFVEHERGEK